MTSDKTVLFLRSNGFLNEKSPSLSELSEKQKTRIVRICTSFTCAGNKNNGVIKNTISDDCPDCGHALFHQRMSENEIKSHNQKQYLQRRNTAAGGKNDKRRFEATL